jgi:hypothetical protein
VPRSRGGTYDGPPEPPTGTRYAAENALAAALRIPGGQKAYYQVIPRHKGSTTVPFAFMIYAYGGRSGLTDNQAIGNLVYDQYGFPYDIGPAAASNGTIPTGPAR